MSWILIFSLSLSAFTTLMLLYYSFMLWQFRAPIEKDGFFVGMRVTAPWTWSLKFTAMVIQTGQLLFSVFYINGLNAFVATIPPAQLVFSSIMGASIRMLLMLFVMNSYYSLKGRFK